MDAIKLTIRKWNVYLGPEGRLWFVWETFEPCCAVVRVKSTTQAVGTQVDTDNDSDAEVETFWTLCDGNGPGHFDWDVVLMKDLRSHSRVVHTISIESQQKLAMEILKELNIANK